MRIFVHSRRDLGREDVLLKYEQGWAHDPSAYGFDAGEGIVEDIQYSTSRPANWLSTRLFNWLGFDVLHALDNLKAMRRADAIWTVLEWEWLGASFLQRVGLLQKKPIIANSVWLCEHWTEWSSKRRIIYRALMTNQLNLTLHSRGALKRTQDIFPGKTFKLLHFGISTRAFPITKPSLQLAKRRPVRVYSIGTDKTRDWSTMLVAFGNDNRFDIRIVSGAVDQDDEKHFTNVKLRSRANVEDQRANYRWADFVIMPMVENCFSGISVLCEAAAMGKPIISSRTGGADTYFDETELIFVPPGNPEALRSAALNTSPEGALSVALAAQARFLRSDYSSKGMVRRYCDSTDLRLKGKMPGHRPVNA